MDGHEMLSEDCKDRALDCRSKLKKNIFSNGSFTNHLPIFVVQVTLSRHKAHPMSRNKLLLEA